ncbi:MAG TPA: hypothetical protein VGX76_16475, partial [Pirellulales bacterium]|nr:hypothetical protein [Pirellulales bacterium]
MDEKIAATPPADGGPNVPTLRSQQRRRAQEALAAQRAHLDRLENEFPRELERLAAQIARELADSRPADPGGPGVDAPQLDELRQQLAARQGEVEQSTARFEQA